MEEKFIKSELRTKATASLKEEVEKELEIKDPSEEKARAALGGNSVKRGCCCRKRSVNNEVKDS